jgi:hypothetical protein
MGIPNDKTTNTNRQHMTVGSWEPDSEKVSIPKDALLAAIDLMKVEFPTETPDNIKPLQPFAKSDKTLWQECVNDISSSDIKLLCQFFTLAESNWTDWFGGDRNPVIWLCKILKKRGDFPDKELTNWIKQNTDNRFLPYGNVLG